MAHATRQEALTEWVPEKAIVLYDYEATVVYIHDGGLVVLRVFEIGSHGVKHTWHVSVDVDKKLHALERMLT